MKQKIMIIVCLSLGLLTNQLQAITENNRLIEELQQIEQIFETNNQKLQYFQLQLRETIEKNKIEHYMTKLNQIFEDTNMDIEDTKHATKYIWNRQINSKMNESIMIVEAKKASTAEIVYALDVNEELPVEKSIAKSHVYHLTGNIFTNEVTKFTCAKTEVSDMIDSVYFFEKIKKILQVQEVHQLDEQDFTVFSGYTSYWKRSIPSDHNKMNIQMAARQVPGKKTIITIGTPILTTEY
ncbi:hypothetical protein BN1058_00422 [Paraliobacillus sp. PM-2]|uniref:YwmB family TATA-box binding protein n=1 Tax=Paraliobacillus sp. PM-2 TaxID=1462524 RepID=UPI00061BFE7E|nr:YwmB family TATA-box binding protein [Paraliobacillus sp. PM-2]CQR46172.1 hypothetical protein BN1058_00422 [Paraliobacillus sp. PM-2]